MAINTDFNVGKGIKAPRKLLVTWVDVGNGETLDWELLGKGIEESTITTNFETETVNDILGNAETSVTSAAPTQDISPFTVRGGSKLAFLLHEIWLNKDYARLSQFKVLTGYKYIGGTEKTGFEADMQTDCTIVFESIGGSAYVDMPITINYSDNKQRGTVTVTEGVPTFTPTATEEE